MKRVCSKLSTLVRNVAFHTDIATEQADRTTSPLHPLIANNPETPRICVWPQTTQSTHHTVVSACCCVVRASIPFPPHDRKSVFRFPTLLCVSVSCHVDHYTHSEVGVIGVGTVGAIAKVPGRPTRWAACGRAPPPVVDEGQVLAVLGRPPPAVGGYDGLGRNMAMQPPRRHE